MSPDNIESFPAQKSTAPATAATPKPGEPKKPTGWIGVALDGVLAVHDFKAPVDIAVIGEPIAPTLARLKAILSQGWEVKIFTARAMHPDAETIIHAWLLKHDLPILEVTDRIDSQMVRLWENRAITVQTNVGITNLDELSLQRQDLDLLAIGLGIPQEKGRNFHQTYRAIVDTLTELEAVAAGSLDFLGYLRGDNFKGGEHSQAFKDVCAARTPLRKFVEGLGRFKKFIETKEEPKDAK